MARIPSIGLEQARANLPAVAAHAHEGGVSLITRHGKPYAAVVPVEVALRGRAVASLLALRGTGKGLWGSSARQHVGKLRDEWAQTMPHGGKGARSWDALPDGAKVVVDSAPIIYLLEDNARYAPRFAPLFEAEAERRVQIAISTVTLAEVLAGPYAKGQDALALRYAKALGAFEVVPVGTEVAVSAARLRARYRLKLPDAIQLATALEIGADALVTHDRDFSAVEGMVILDGH